jgi:23S rRNA (cytosine1962-C5)-methyltransferase
VFGGAVAQVRGEASPGATVVVRASDGRFLARAAHHPGAAIAARVWSFDEDEAVDEELILGRLERAVAARAELERSTDAVRWVHGEGDLLPGLVVDRYGPAAVVQLHTAGVERWRGPVVDWLAARPGVEAVVERSAADIRRREGLEPSRGLRAGRLDGDRVEIEEGNGDGRRWRFGVDVTQGHKTGFYLDQRDSRRVVAGVAAGRRVLDVFAYSGGFTVAAGSGGAATLTAVESSGPALAQAAHNLAANGLGPARLVEADAFRDLRVRRDAGERYDLIVLDPPKLAPNAAAVPRATRAYKDVNWLACRLLERGGLLVTFSCSGAVSAELFQKVVFGAALDAGVELQVIGRLAQPADHPVLLAAPETEYLTGLVCRRP